MIRYFIVRQIRRHDEYGIFAHDRLSFSIGDSTLQNVLDLCYPTQLEFLKWRSYFIKKLQKSGENIWVCFIHFIQQYDCLIEEEIIRVPQVFAI